MITSLLLRNRSIYVLLILILLSSCYSSRQVACPEIDTDHPRTRRYKRNFSLARNHSRKIPKKSVLITPAAEKYESVEERNDDMTLLESKKGDLIVSDRTGFIDNDPVRSSEINGLVASGDATFTGPPEIVVFDGSVDITGSWDKPSKKEVRRIRRDIRKDMRESLRSSDSGGLHHDDTIMLFAVTSFVLGIIGIFTMPLLLGLLATIFGAIALGMIRREGTYYGKGLATTGLIIGIVLMVVGIILLPFAILGIFI